MVNFIPWIVSAVVAAFSAYTMRQKVNVFLMRFFRDVSRYKSRKRLYGNQAALMPILMGKEEPIEINTDISEHGEDYTMTLSKCVAFCWSCASDFDFLDAQVNYKNLMAVPQRHQFISPSMASYMTYQKLEISMVLVEIIIILPEKMGHLGMQLAAPMKFACSTRPKRWKPWGRMKWIKLRSG